MIPRGMCRRVDPSRFLRFARSSWLLPRSFALRSRRSGRNFVQQGRSWFGSGAVGTAGQGISVALSADGNTAIVGGPATTHSAGAAWVFIAQRRRLGPAGIQAGRHRRGRSRLPRLLRRAVGRRQHRHRGRILRQLERRGGVGVHPQRRRLDPAGQQAGRHRRGRRRRIQGVPSRSRPTATPPSSAGLATTQSAGAAWVFTRSGGVWTQQGSKLVGTGAVGDADLGSSVALSADGNTAIVGGPGDNARRGGVGVHPQRRASGPSRVASWSAPARRTA